MYDQTASNSFDLPKQIGLIAGPLLFAALMYFKPFALTGGGNEVVAVFAWMLTWWVTEAVPLAVTGLLPMVLFSLTGVMTLNEAVVPYSNKIIYLFFGGFVLALGLEEHGLHRRIALKIISVTGVSPQRLLLGFLISTIALGMWISNTATAVVMLPMALTVLKLLNLEPGAFTDSDEFKARQRFAASLVLIIAYGANISGIGTVIGTPTNLVMRSYFSDMLQTEIPFFTWMLWAMPILMVLSTALYLLFVYVLFPVKGLKIENAESVIAEERKKLGPMTWPQWMMLAIFLATVFAWMFRSVIVAWLPWLKLTDEIIALSAAISLFAIPADWKKSQPLLGWDAMKRLPWGILLLIGGGLALAAGFERTGVISTLAEHFKELANGHVWLTLILLTTLAMCATEVMSNVALVSVLVPILCGIAISMGVDPVRFAFPATLAASCSFMLPMATPPNAIVFASGHVTVRQMVQAGFWMNIVSLVVIIVLTQPLLRLFKL